MNEQSENIYCQVFNRRRNPYQQYYCLDCDQELIPRQGKIRAHHYAHKSVTKCSGESSTHKYCKWFICNYYRDIIFNAKCIECNQILYVINHKDPLCSIKEEQIFDKYKLDSAIFREKKIITAIEITHTHKTDAPKIAEIIKAGIKYIDIESGVIINSAARIDTCEFASDAVLNSYQKL